MESLSCRGCNSLLLFFTIKASSHFGDEALIACLHVGRVLRTDVSVHLELTRFVKSNFWLIVDMLMLDLVVDSVCV